MLRYRSVGTAWLLLLVLSESNAINDEFMEWTREHNKVYASKHDEEAAYKTYLENVEHVRVLNEQYKSRNVEFKLNQFADLSEDEFRRNVLMRPRPAPEHVQNIVKMSKIQPQDIPNAYDWRDHGVVTEIKNQGSVGSCWAFSTCANIEGQWALKGNKLMSFSVEQLVDCDGSQDTVNGNADCGVFGGWPYLAFQYISKAGGLASWDDYSYCSGNGKCFPCPAHGYNKTLCGPPTPYCNMSQSCAAGLKKNKFVPGLKVKSYISIGKNETVMLTELYQRGPLSVLINAITLQFYHKGVWDPLLACSPSDLDHAVLLVGYGTESSLFKDKPYWVIKNSWGEKWGEDGYFRMIRGKSRCGIDQGVTSAILE
ncbi:cathepsin L-like isoform X2 [Dysidea avara]|uniref:cathepsin L-like isoform X2 n=1 Tax=Dysidea avara TaxID=196820 RepID=UPI00332D24DF